MNPNPSNWQHLATRVRSGEVEAAVRLRDELSPQMVRLVRRTLCSGTGASPLDRQILAEADSVHTHHPDQPRNSEEMIRLVTQRLCARLLQPQTRPFLPTHARPDECRLRDWLARGATTDVVPPRKPSRTAKWNRT